jgi:hypothetical protein
METNNTHDAEDTAASFEKPARRYGLLAGFAAFALAAGLAGGYALSGGGETALAVDTTTTTASAGDSDEEASEAAGTDSEPFEVDFSEDNGEETDKETPAQADDGKGSEEPAPEPEPEPKPDPDPAELAVDDTVDVGNGEEGSFTIHNLGDEDLDINSVSGPATLSFDDVPAIIGGGDSVEIGLTVDTSGLAFGAYEMEFVVKSSAGSETVKVTGTKEAVILLPPPSPDIDVQDQVVVPHLTPVAPIKIWNNEDESVKVTLESLHPRLILPAEANLAPGLNVILGTITPYAVQPANAMALNFEVSWWLGSEEATVLKIGQ